MTSAAGAGTAQPLTSAGRARRRVMLFSALCVVTGVAGVVFVTWQRQANYRALITYDVSADQHATFDDKLSAQQAIDIDDALTWPTIDGEWRSAFLTLDVDTSWLGAMLDPYVELQTDAGVIRQYVERGASGTRWINVSPLLSRRLQPGTRIPLRGQHLSWAHGKATLSLLRAPVSTAPSDGPLLVLAPHPDDAEIAAFGLYSSQLAWVVTVTLGENGSNLYGALIESERAAYLEKARVRVWDSLTIPQLGGVSAERTANLGYFDGSLQSMFRDQDKPTQSATLGIDHIDTLRSHGLDQVDAKRTPRAATWRNLVDDLRRLITELRPHTVVLPHPQLDSHPDHQLTTIAFLHALQGSGVTGGQLWLYTNHCLGAEPYPFGPSEGVVSLPPMPDRQAYFQSVVSHPLSRLHQARKAIALQTEHDLVAPPAKPPRLRRLVRNSVEQVFERLTDVDLSYDRRAVRPNELFFVVEYEQAKRLLDAFTHSADSAVSNAVSRDPQATP